MGANQSLELTWTERKVAEDLKQQAVEVQGKFFVLDKMLKKMAGGSNIDPETIERLKQKGVLINRTMLCGNFEFIIFLYQAFKEKGFEPTHDNGTRYCFYYELVVPN